MRWIFRFIGLIVILVVVAAVSLLLLPGDRIARIAADKIKAQTGRDLVIAGDVKISYWPVLGVSTGPITFGNADWSDAGPLLSAQSASIGVNAAALLGGDVRITKIEADSPVIRLETRKDGRANWVLGSGGTVPGGTTPTLEALSVTNARLIYAPEGSPPTDLAGVDLDLSWPDPQGAATLKAVMRPSGKPVRIDAEITSFGEWIKGAALPVVATVDGPGGKVRFEGRASTAAELAGALSINAKDSTAFLDALGLGPISLPDGFGRAMAMDGSITLTKDGRFALRDAAVQLDQNRFAGAADVVLGAVPQVNAQFTAGDLDFSALSRSDNAEATEAGWSRARIDAGGLAAFEGAVSLVAGSVDLGNLKFGKTRVLMNLDRSRAVFDLRELRAYDGVISGEFVANNRSGLSVGGKILAQKVETKGFLGDLMDVHRLSGPADMELNFLGVGQSVDAIMRSLSGNGALKMTKGHISGIDLDRLMRVGDGSGGTTVFDSLGASFAIKDGNLTNNDLLTLLPNFRADGQGRIGLGAQDIDYTFTPKALRANKGRGIAIPVRIVGPWANPKIRPDLEAAINLNLAEEKKEITNRVKENVQRKIGEELGVAPTEGQSIEDAAKDKLEDKLKKELFKIFD